MGTDHLSYLLPRFCSYAAIKIQKQKLMNHLSTRLIDLIVKTQLFLFSYFRISYRFIKIEILGPLSINAFFEQISMKLSQINYHAASFRFKIW
jgi:hypothetical protein